MKAEDKFFYKNRETFNTIHDLILRAYQKYPDIVYCKYIANGEVRSKTYSEMYQAATAIGCDIKANCKNKCHAALLGTTSFEWLTSYLGCIYCGVVAVPVDRQLSKENLLAQIDYADAEVLLYDDKFSDVAEYIKNNSSCCRRFINFDRQGPDEYFWDIVLKNQQHVDVSKIEIDPLQLAQIVYTSGTTGTSKGVMLSHRNIASNINLGIQVVNMKPGETLLSVMPNHHTYELTVGIMAPLYFGLTTAINDNIGRLITNFKIFKPACIAVVPLLLKIVQKEILSKIKKQKKESAFAFAVQLSNFLKLFHIDITKKLFAQVHEVFGGSLNTIFSGGSFLKEELIVFYRNIGINIIQGYGITECSPVISCNSDRYSRKGTVGMVGSEYKVKIVDGEILVKGDNVMMGYYKNPELTAEVMDGEWFKTGDLGMVDEDNFIKLTGRKKNLIILSNGENVSPEELEDLLDDIDIIDTAMVYEKDDELAVEVFPKETYVKEKEVTNVYETVCDEIYKLNATLPVYKQIKSIKLRDTQFEKTSTLKIKRNIYKKEPSVLKL